METDVNGKGILTEQSMSQYLKVLTENKNLKTNF
jgi:hypothetical protein